MESKLDISKTTETTPVKERKMRVAHSAHNSLGQQEFSSPLRLTNSAKNSISKSGIAITPSAAQLQSIFQSPVSQLEKSMLPRTGGFIPRSNKNKETPDLPPLPFLPSIIQDPFISREKKKGNEAFKSGDYKQAFIFYDKAIEKDRGMKYPKILFRRGLCLEHLNMLNQALHDYAAAYNLTYDGEYLRALNSISERIYRAAIPEYRLGQAAQAELKYETAVEHYSKSISADPSFPDSYFQRAESYKMLKNDKLALVDYVRADFRFLTKDMKIRCRKEADQIEQRLYTEAYKERKVGDKYFDQEKWQQAIVHYTKSIEIQPTYDAAYFNRAIAYAKEKNYAAALDNAALAHKLAVRPDRATRYANAIDWMSKKIHKKATWAKKRGDKCVKHQNWTRAIWWYTYAISKDRTFPHPYFNRGLCNEQLGHFDAAMEDYVQARELFKREDLIENCRRAIDRLKQAKSQGVPLSPLTQAVINEFVFPLDLARQKSESVAEGDEDEEELSEGEVEMEEKDEKALELASPPVREAELSGPGLRTPAIVSGTSENEFDEINDDLAQKIRKNLFVEASESVTVPQSQHGDKFAPLEPTSSPCSKLGASSPKSTTSLLSSARDLSD